MKKFKFVIFSVYEYCEKDKEPLRCWVGDLTSKLGNLNVAGKILDLSSTKMFFTDSNLPLTGDASIIGHSLVIHDDHAPKHRGERMACTAIRRLYRHKECFTTLYTDCIISRQNSRYVLQNIIYYTSATQSLILPGLVYIFIIEHNFHMQNVELLSPHITWANFSENYLLQPFCTFSSELFFFVNLQSDLHFPLRMVLHSP